ncbi:TetR/AcrR family transcriptional regulator [Streptomyces luteolus]|uniref:TetR family transcriptional regulator n=1 Tax=Streptomyces luteolus TaxID=3043615 RepID=A0ABT6SWG9_9ACTN|nr:TetR/AcrR family transcriptional regulator [Streptomyces sp. B-S-A12]MDI3419560.1 TetR family transcriptional regulator [Streptomyces sp. B-S-A12]
MTPVPTPAPTPAPAPGLRERKKLKTRSAIRSATYELIAAQGYEATTVEQIAAAAEVSPSTVIRYFPAKEDIVLGAEYEQPLEAALRSRPADEPVLTSLRYAIKAQLGADLDDTGLRLRCRLLRDVPEVRARMTESLTDTARRLCPLLAERTGRPATDLQLRVLVTAVAQAVLEVALHWAEGGRREDLTRLVDEALDVFADGI